MTYLINTNEIASSFSVPDSVVDKHIKLASLVQIRVLLLCLKNIGDGISPLNISNELRVSEADVTDALNFWVDCGVLTAIGDANKNTTSQPQKTIRPKVVKPDREEVAKRGLESEEIAFMLNCAQMKLGRGLRQNESSTFVWLHDDEGVDVGVILTLISFALTEEKYSVSFIEKTAVDWLNSGVKTPKDAEEMISKYYSQKNAWGIVISAFGMEYRRPSKKESETALRWLEEYKYTKDILQAAYDKCVDTISKFDFNYVSKIIEGWHKEGLKSLEDIQKYNESFKQKNENDGQMDTYDIELFEKKLHKTYETE